MLELCTDFKETLELNKWENWYTDQYLQHFQPSISPACVLSTSQTSGEALSPAMTPTSDLMTSPAASLATIKSDDDNDDHDDDDDDGDDDDGDNDDDDDGEEDDRFGIRFASNTDKDKIITYLAEGNTVADAERLFEIPQSTINVWLSSIKQQSSSTMETSVPDLKQEPIDEDLDFDEHNLNASAFSHPIPSKSKGLTKKSAFCRKVK